jgi:predicted lipoprotein with Yx(FWY)xxD motif
MRKAHMHALQAGVAAAIAAIALAACGGSSSTTPASGSGSISTPASSSTSTGASTASGSATVKLINVSGYGKALATSSGKPLFELVGGSCTSSCESIWPPLTVSGTPNAGSGTSASLLATAKSASGKTQVTYAGQKLYTFTGPTAASGEGMAADGGIWYLVGADGKPIKKTAAGGY